MSNSCWLPATLLNNALILHALTLILSASVYLTLFRLSPHLLSSSQMHSCIVFCKIRRSSGNVYFPFFFYIGYADVGANTRQLKQDLTSGGSEWVTGPLKYAAKVRMGRFRSVQFIILIWMSVCFTIGAQMHTYSLSELVTGLLSPTHISHKST